MIILRDSRKVNANNQYSPLMLKKLEGPTMEPGLLHRLSYCRILIMVRLRQHRVTDRQIAELVAEDWGEMPSNSSINQIFAGMQKDITTRQARAIARAAGVDAGWLVTGEGVAPPGYVPLDEPGEGTGGMADDIRPSKGPSPTRRKEEGPGKKNRRAG